MDTHIRSNHKLEENEEVRFVCIVYQHKFTESEDYDSHVKQHESVSEKDESIEELRNIVFCHLAEHHLGETERESKDDKSNESEIRLSCNKCEFVSNCEKEVKAHNQTGYQSLKVDINTMHRTIKYNTGGYECMLNIQLKKTYSGQT